MGLLALIPFKDKVYGVLIILLILLGVHVHHKILAEGVAKQQAADVAASAELTKETTRETTELRAKAAMAEQAYDKEHQAIFNVPALPAVRLCGNPHPRGSIVPGASTANQGNAAPSTAPGNIQQVPSGDPGVGGEQHPDISFLLSLLAQHADDYSAELREFQSR